MKSDLSDCPYFHHFPVLTIVPNWSVTSQYFAAYQRFSFIFLQATLNKYCVYCGDCMCTSYRSSTGLSVFKRKIILKLSRKCLLKVHLNYESVKAAPVTSHRGRVINVRHAHPGSRRRCRPVNVLPSHLRRSKPALPTVSMATHLSLIYDVGKNGSMTKWRVSFYFCILYIYTHSIYSPNFPCVG